MVDDILIFGGSGSPRLTRKTVLREAAGLPLPRCR